MKKFSRLEFEEPQQFVRLKRAEEAATTHSYQALQKTTAVVIHVEELTAKMAQVATAPEIILSPKDTLQVLVSEAGERIITLQEVADHDSPYDCWVVIYDRVYDITAFLDEHPGGAEIMLEYAGRDASTAFRGSGHSRNAKRALDRFLVGELPMHERLYRRPGGIKLSDMPE